MKNKKNIILITSIVLILALIGFYFTFVKYSPYIFGLEKRTIYASVDVAEESGGFDLNAAALTFGKMKKGDSQTSNWIFKNDYNSSVIVKISSSGEINKLLRYENDILVLPGEAKKIGFSVKSPSDSREGLYEGFVQLKVVPAS